MRHVDPFSSDWGIPGTLLSGLRIQVQIFTLAGPQETCQYLEPYRLWQPHFWENICLEVASFLIFSVSPGAPRQHMFPACPQDMAASVRSTLASYKDASSHTYCLPHSITSCSLPLLFFLSITQMSTYYTDSRTLKKLSVAPPCH